MIVKAISIVQLDCHIYFNLGAKYCTHTRQTPVSRYISFALFYSDYFTHRYTLPDEKGQNRQSEKRKETKERAMATEGE